MFIIKVLHSFKYAINGIFLFFRQFINLTAPHGTHAAIALTAACVPVLGNILHIARIGPFKFLDPTWCYPKKAVYDFCKFKIKFGMKFKWEGMVHAAFIDKDMLKIMKESGCDVIY